MAIAAKSCWQSSTDEAPVTKTITFCGEDALILGAQFAEFGQRSSPDLGLLIRLLTGSLLSCCSSVCCATSSAFIANLPASSATNALPPPVLIRPIYYGIHFVWLNIV